MIAWKSAIQRAMRQVGIDVVRAPADVVLGPHLMELFRRLRVNCVIDAGARGGGYGRLLRRSGYTGRIVSFEPVTESFRILEQASARDPRWLVRQEALGSADETATINVTESTLFSSFLQVNDYGRATFPESETAREEDVVVRRLDSIFEECVPNKDSCVFLKMDTQGWDLEVLRGCGDRLEEIAGLQSEVAVQQIYDGMPGFVEAISYFERLGYDVTGFFPVTRDAHFRVVEFDCVLVRRPSRGEGDALAKSDATAATRRS